MIKQIIVIRMDLIKEGKMSIGKTIGQACHASNMSFLKSDEEIRQKWIDENNYKKIILQAKSEKELLKLKKKCEDNNIPHFLVKDLGYTELEPNTITALGIGPDYSEKIDKITKRLRLFNYEV